MGKFLVLLGFLVAAQSGYALTAYDDASWRRELREKIMEHAPRTGPWRAPEANDLARYLVDELRYETLDAIERAGLFQARLPEAPWSGPYWPTYTGQIANRYFDYKYEITDVWKENAAYLERARGLGSDDELSAAEKYDLLVGDPEFTLTKRNVQIGARYADAEGVVEKWLGLCHGWAPASFMTPRPMNSVRVTAANGRAITFSPTDLKSLATLLWANAMGAIRFVGGRCDKREPGDEEEADCFDTNPATWHLAVVNQIGAARRSLIIDTSADYEVWNQPVTAYRYYYVNPVTRRAGYSLQNAAVERRNYWLDPYARFRSPDTSYVVNIVMVIEYKGETTPRDPPEMDADHGVTYYYDLELDERWRVIGGEWHSETHPDFLWVPLRDAKAKSEGDRQLDTGGDAHHWNGDAPVPPEWAQAIKASSARAQPLARIVDRLFELAR